MLSILYMKEWTFCILYCNFIELINEFLHDLPSQSRHDEYEELFDINIKYVITFSIVILSSFHKFYYENNDK